MDWLDGMGAGAVMVRIVIGRCGDGAAEWESMREAVLLFMEDYLYRGFLVDRFYILLFRAKLSTLDFVFFR